METEFIFDLKNLVVTFANACHEMRAEYFRSDAHAHAANKDIISCILTQHNQHNTDKFVIAQVMKKYDKNGCFILHVTCETMKIELLFSRDFNFIRTGKNGIYYFDTRI